MLSLKEHIAVEEAVKFMYTDEDNYPFTDEQIEAAEFFELKWNPVSDQTELHIFDGDGQSLVSVGFSDPEVAMAVVEDIFELDDDDILSMQNYEWADNFDDRVWDSLQDDGTSD